MFDRPPVKFESAWNIYKHGVNFLYLIDFRERKKVINGRKKHLLQLGFVVTTGSGWEVLGLESG
jgi:hypothetical protein